MEMIADKLEEKFESVFEELLMDVESGQITEDQFSMKVVNLSYECALQGFATDAFYMFLNINPKYFLSQAIKDFDMDEEYLKRANFMFEVFKYKGWVEEYIEVTQREAEA